jgi:tetratricopeptide (TPR) repeat protein
LAQLIERILVWVAALVTVAALVAVILNSMPPNFLGLHFRRSQPAPGGAAAIDLAEQAVARNDPAKALKLAAQAVKDNPNDASIANRAGNVALRADDPKDAELYYREGESADPRYPWNFVALGQLYEREGKKDLADAQLRVATATAPDQPFIHYDLGVVELEEGLYAAALADFNTELQRSPTYRPAMIGRAEALEKLGRRGEAVAFYRKAGVPAKQRVADRPRLTVKPIAAPTPSPPPSPVATPAPALAAVATPAFANSRKQLARAAAPTHAPKAVRSAAARAPTPSPQASVIVATAPTATATPLSIVSDDAKNYLLDVTQDLGFTQTLPAADSSQSTAALNTKLNFALASRPPNVEEMLSVGSAALLSGRIALASRAFTAASQAAPGDWRGPYFAGLTAQADGDLLQAKNFFSSALQRNPRAEVYTSLAVVDLQNDDVDAAATNAARAAQVNPAYEPGRFVAGMIALIQSDILTARSNLTAAQALGGAPSRTAYFLAAISQKS